MGTRAGAGRAVAALALTLSLAAGAAPAVPPAPSTFVTDEPQFLSPGTRDALERRLAAYQSATGHQAIVWIGKELRGDSIEDFAAHAFTAWGVGRKGHDDGVAIFLFPAERRVRIEVGYGLEDRLTDLASAHIIRDEVIPRLQRGDHDGAVTAAVSGVLAVLGGEAGAPPAGAAPAARGLGLGQIIVGGIVLLLFVGFAITHPSLAAALLFTMSSGGGRGGGGWGGGGGGFSGGGGRSGGGGASGSW